VIKEGPPEIHQHHQVTASKKSRPKTKKRRKRKEKIAHPQVSTIESATMPKTTQRMAYPQNDNHWFQQNKKRKQTIHPQVVIVTWTRT
jgi:hypothetical protein